MPRYNITQHSAAGNAVIVAKAADRRERVVELSKQGLDPATIASKLKVSTRTVERARAHAGLATKRYDFATEDEKLRAKMLLHDGASYEEVGRTLHRDPQTVSNWHPGYTWTKQQTGQAAALSRKFRQLEKLTHLEKV